MNLFAHAVWAAANALWQSAALAAVAWGTLRCLSRPSAALRYAVWGAVLVAAALLPVVDFALPARVASIPAFAPASVAKTESEVFEIARAETGIAPTAMRHSVIAETSTAVGHAATTGAGHRATVGVAGHAATAGAQPAAGSDSAPLRYTVQDVAASVPVAAPILAWKSVVGRFASVVSWLFDDAKLIVWLWALGALALLARLALGFLRLRHIKRSLIRLNGADVAASCASVGRPVTIGASDDVDCPCVIGYVRPVVALPSSLIRELDSPNLRRVLAHEMAHVRRWDDWTNLLQQIVRAVWFINPVIHIANRQLDVNREIACDDLVAASHGDRLEYAKCLTEIARRTTFSEHLVPAAGFFPDRKQIVVRIEQLLDRNHAGSVRVGAAPAVCALLAAIAVIALAKHQVPAFAQDGAAHASGQVAQATFNLAPLNLAPINLESLNLAPLNAAHREPDPAVGQPASDAAQAELARAAAALSHADTARAAEAIARAVAARASGARSISPAQKAQLARMADMLAKMRHGYRQPTGAGLNFSRVDELKLWRSMRTVNATSWALTQRGPILAIADTASAAAMQAVAAKLATLHDTGSSSGSTGELDDFLNALSAAGYTHLSVDDLIRLRNAGVSSRYLRALKEYGVPPMSIDRLVQLANSGVDAEFIGGMRSAGYTGLSVDDLIKAANSGVGPDFARSIAASIRTHPSLDTLMRLADAGVSSQYVANLAKFGYQGLSADTLVKLANAGVSSEFIGGMTKLGYGKLGVDSMIRLANSGVTPSYVQSLASAGYSGLSVDSLIKMADAGVTAQLIESLRKHGIGSNGNLSVDELIKLANAGF